MFALTKDEVAFFTKLVKKIFSATFIPTKFLAKNTMEDGMMGVDFAGFILTTLVTAVAIPIGLTATGLALLTGILASPPCMLIDIATAAISSKNYAPQHMSNLTYPTSTPNVPEPSTTAAVAKIINHTSQKYSSRSQTQHKKTKPTIKHSESRYVKPPTKHQHRQEAMKEAVRYQRPPGR